MRAMSSCCGEYDAEEVPTVRHLIHDLSSPWVDLDKPAVIEFYAPGEPENTKRLAITGITVTERGQTLEYEFL
jgi:hypothetical protein